MSDLFTEWRPVPGYEDLYEVSCKGAIRRIKTRNGRPICRPVKPWQNCDDRDGRSHDTYLRVDLSRAGKSRKFYVHRLVCEAFHGAPKYDHLEAHHKDHNRFNNSAVNLEWITRTENNWAMLEHHAEKEEEPCPF